MAVVERSQNGWPVVEPRKDGELPSALRVFTVPGQTRDVDFKLLAGAPGFVMAHFILWFDREVEDIEVPSGDDYAWSYRSVTGGDDWSNHASATAVDLNSSLHPYGETNTFTSTQQARIIDGLEVRYRNLIKAGMTYRGTKDDMHFEFIAGKTLIRELAVDLFDTTRGIKIREANPWFTWTPKQVEA